ncbi:EamA family transporter [Burkholderia sp. ZZQ-2]|uniref:DMT family transporter n=1 Tax=Burkholderia TaxID=32008 RepID=UPI000F680056|nr:EamA family transporter [Burkholderia cenocepacia]RSB88098.1 EamA family transporter [Burkholderia cenocepacia]
MALFGVVITILMWSTLAASVASLHDIPTLLVNGIALTIGGLIGLPWARQWRMPFSLALLGTASMFGYHALYFYALQIGEPVGVSLIHYLWPLLIVLFTPATRRANTSPMRHLLGILIGFGGAALACLASVHHPASSTSALGLAPLTIAYALALLSAFAWAGYSLLGPRYESVSSHSVGLFCLVAGLASLALFSVRGQWPSLSLQQTASLAYLGIGPMGTAFYLWDYGMKRCDPGKVAMLSYLTPVLSTIVLCAQQGQPVTALTWTGAALVTISIAMTGRAKSRPAATAQRVTTE